VEAFRRALKSDQFLRLVKLRADVDHIKGDVSVHLSAAQWALRHISRVLLLMLSHKTPPPSRFHFSLFYIFMAANRDETA